MTNGNRSVMQNTTYLPTYLHVCAQAHAQTHIYLHTYIWPTCMHTSCIQMGQMNSKLFGNFEVEEYSNS